MDLIKFSMANIIEIAHKVRLCYPIALLCLICFNVSAQKVDLNIEASPDDPTEWNLAQMSIDSLKAYTLVDSLHQAWLAEGYLNAAIDTLMFGDENAALARIYRGYKYDQFNLQLDTEASNWLQEAGLHRMKWIRGTYDHQHVRNVMDKLIQYFENNGYPFASVRLDSVTTHQGEISARLDIDPSKYVTFDTIDIVGTAEVSQSFMSRYLDIRKGQPYSLKKVLATKQKITSLPYCKLDADPRISFINGKAVLRLEMLKKQASVFDFIIGVLPNSEDGQQKFTITGEFTGDLQNELGYGERIYAKYQRLRPETQELDLKFNMPYISDWPFGIDADFGLFRNSSSFLDLNAKLGTQYLFSGLNYLDLSWYFSSSRLVEVDTNAILASKRLPTQLDVNYTGGGVGVGIDAVDYRYNPTKGYQLKFNAKAGIKTIIPNESIKGISENGVDFSMAYDTVRLKTFQTELHAEAAYYIPVQSWAAIKTEVRSAYKYNEAKLYDNELFRIGGNKLMRGFDEQSIWGDFYAVSTAEFRVLLDQNSFLSFPFIDYGYAHTLKENELHWEHLLGFGLGLNFGTPAGLFNVSFAMGRRADIPFDFNAAKIHFGYVSLF